jgi:hypothetical protein
MNNKKIFTEIFRINEIINSFDKKNLLKESLSDELVEILTKFLSKGSDELTNMGIKNSDELITLIKNFPTANVLDQASILKTIVVSLGDNIIKEIAKSTVDDLTTGVGKFLNDQSKQYIELYEKGLMTYDEVMTEITDDMTKLMSKSSDELSSLKNSLSDAAKSKIKNSLDSSKSTSKQSVTQSPKPQSYLDNLSKEELIKRHNSYSWKDLNQSTNSQMSGWKFHIFGEDVKDAIFLTDKLTPIAQKYNATAKIGGEYHFNAELFKPGQKQHGKAGVTMYIPTDVIKAGRQQEMLTDIQNAISGYEKGGTIQGDQMITPQIHYRYELKGPIDYGEGISRKNNIPAKNSDGTPMIKDGKQVYTSEYSQMYTQNEGGPYKPNDVEDLFRVNNSSSVNKTVKSIGDGFLSTKFGDTSKINWDLITNAKNISDYDVIINDAIKNKDFSKISRGGFENYGITNFRDYLMNIYNN